MRAAAAVGAARTERRASSRRTAGRRYPRPGWTPAGGSSSARAPTASRATPPTRLTSASRPRPWARLRRECRAVGHHGACSISRLREAISTRLSHSVVPEHHAERHARRGRRAATPCGRSPSPLVSWRRSSLRAREPEALRRPRFDRRALCRRLRQRARARRRRLKGRRAACNLYNASQGDCTNRPQTTCAPSLEL